MNVFKNFELKKKKKINELIFYNYNLCHYKNINIHSFYNTSLIFIIVFSPVK